MSALARAYERDRIARIREGLGQRPEPVAVEAVPAPPVLAVVSTPVARCAYCGAKAQWRGVPATCHAHSDLPALERS